MLVDTSIWIDHFRRHDERLAALLDDGLVVTHPFVIGELACGNLAQRNEVLELISALPSAPVADDKEVLAFIESRRLMGRGARLDRRAFTRIRDAFVAATLDVGQETFRRGARASGASVESIA